MPDAPSPIPLADHGFGIFGPTFGAPPGGFCLSAFLFLRRRGQVLVGRMKEDPSWEREWAPNLRQYTREMRDGAFAKLRFPATYIREGEHPDAAVQRLWRDQLRLPEPIPAMRSPRIFSEAGDSRRFPGRKHWDVIFLYDLPGPKIEQTPAHWAELRYQKLADLTEQDFGMLHGELLALSRAP